MDNDPCMAKVYWSTIAAASPDSTFAGVLAGLLIAAVAALIVWHEQGATESIALFGSGVPILALATYLFTVIGALHYPSDIDYTDNLCNQSWSEWLLATSSLFIGSAVLVCGLGWALVSYADNLAVSLCEKYNPIERILIERIEYVRKFAIRLSALISVAVTTAATALLIVTSVLYLGGIGQNTMHLKILGHETIFGVTWYVLYFVYLFGLYFIGRAAYVVYRRTRSARRANKKSCAAYPAVGPPVAPANKGIKAGRTPLYYAGPLYCVVRTGLDYVVRKLLSYAVRIRAHLRRVDAWKMRAAKEFALVIVVALGALLAIYLTTGQAFNRPRTDIHVSFRIVLQMVVLYIILRAIYVLFVGIVKPVSGKNDYTPPIAKRADRIRINYEFGRLPAATYSVVFLAIFGTFFVAVVTQGPLWPGPRIIVSLLLGGLYPAVVLMLLSSSVPAATDARRPNWEPLPWLRLYRDALSRRGLD